MIKLIALAILAFLYLVLLLVAERKRDDFSHWL